MARTRQGVIGKKVRRVSETREIFDNRVSRFVQNFPRKLLHFGPAGRFCLARYVLLEAALHRLGA